MKDALEVNSTSDFLDEYWSESFRSKLLVNAEEIDFDAFERSRPHTKRLGYTRDEGYQFPRF